MAHSKGLSSEAASPSATTLLDSSTREPTGRTQKVRPSISISITSCRHGISILVKRLFLHSGLIYSSSPRLRKV